jgi:Fe-S cluster assembly protein SufD
MSEVAEHTDRSHYLTDLETLKKGTAPEWLHALRQESAQRFEEIDMPHYKQESWRFTDIKPIMRTPFRSIAGSLDSSTYKEQVQPHLFDESEWSELVFIDGQYSSELSKIQSLSDGVTLSSLGEAIAGHSELVKPHLNKIHKSTHAFSTLNDAVLNDGGFVHIAANVAAEQPVHFLFISTGAESLATYPRTLIILEQSSQATMVESYIGINDASAYFTNGVTEISVGDNAQLTRYKILKEGEQSYHLGTDAVSEGQDATYTSYVVALEGQINRNEIDLKLNGRGGQCDLNGLYLNDRDRLIDNALHVTHSAAHCYSRMRYKGVLDGSSKSVFTGKVLVPPDSQKTDSDQLNNNLLLSDKATIDTKPQLEIFADDVKCTHGATIGGFPPELLFYFQSRGIDALKANGILTYGFAGEVIDRIELSPLRDRLAKYVFDLYSPEA